MRKSTLYISFTLITIMFCMLLLLHSRSRLSTAEAFLRPCSNAAKELQLTDLCLFTEARYTRHPSMADLHSPFQDHPLSLEHFPSGSLVTPPRFRPEEP